VKTLLNTLPLLAYALGMAGGQLLLKLCAQGVPAHGTLLERLAALLRQPLFYAGAASYAALLILWVWILTWHPLSRAYPFVALSLAATPLLGIWVFDEPWSLRYGVGLLLIVIGVLVIFSEPTRSVP
jgi:drug/metabolite transporter (DMT)-like permease